MKTEPRRVTWARQALADLSWMIGLGGVYAGWIWWTTGTV